jgi:hypothetical protein
MLGSIGDRMLRIALPYVQAWNVWYVDFDNRPENLAPIMARIDAACVEVDRDPASLERTCAVLVAMSGAVGRDAHKPYAPPVPLSGSAAGLAAGLRAFAAAGISHVQVVLDPITVDAVEEFAPVLDALDRGA